MISVIIPAWNEEKYIGECLRSVCDQDFTGKHEVIVVDNRCTDGTAKIAKRMGARVVREERQGLTAAKNCGAEAARGEILVFVDADCKAPRDHLRKIQKWFEDGMIDAVGGPVVYWDGGPLVRWGTEKLNYFYRLFRFYKVVFGIDSFLGGNMAISKSAWRAVGGFNEQITDIVETEDLEMAIRLKKANKKVAFDPDLKIETSYRRVKRSPFRDPIRRTKFVIRLLGRYILGHEFK
jgi:glycosyltransferase involved in cell wall biosynthesis